MPPLLHTLYTAQARCRPSFVRLAALVAARECGEVFRARHGQVLPAPTPGPNIMSSAGLGWLEEKMCESYLPTSSHCNLSILMYDLLT